MILHKKTVIYTLLTIAVVAGGLFLWFMVLKPQIDYKKEVVLNNERMAQIEARLGQVNPELLASLKQSIVDLKNQTVSEPNLSNLWFQLGTNYKNLGDYLNAELALKQAITIDKESITALQNLGSMYVDWGKYKLAEDTYRQIIDRQPLLPDGYVALAELYQSGSYRSQADQEQILLFGEGRTHSNPTILTLLAQYYQGLNNNAKAIEYYQKLITSGRGDTPALEAIIKELQQ